MTKQIQIRHFHRSIEYGIVGGESLMRNYGVDIIAKRLQRNK